MQWVTGHSDVPGNWEVGELAKLGITLQLDSDSEGI